MAAYGSEIVIELDIKAFAMATEYLFTSKLVNIMLELALPAKHGNND